MQFCNFCKTPIWTSFPAAENSSTCLVAFLLLTFQLKCLDFNLINIKNSSQCSPLTFFQWAMESKASYVTGATQSDRISTVEVIVSAILFTFHNRD